MVIRPPLFGCGRCYPGFRSGACRLPLVGLRCLWLPRSCGVYSLRDGATFLRSGLCSSSVHDRYEDFPSFLVGLLPGFRVGSPTSGWRCVLLPAIVLEAVPPSSRFGPAPWRWVPLLKARSVWGLQLFASPVSSFGMWSPFGSRVSFCHS